MKGAILCLILISSGCIFRSNEYPLFVNIQKDCKVNEDSRVLWEGKEIGRVDKIAALDTGTIILRLQIQRQVKLPATSMAQCQENLLGDAEIDISAPAEALSGANQFLQAKDTVNGRYIDRSITLDSNARQKSIDKLKDLKNTVYSIVRDQRSSGDTVYMRTGFYYLANDGVKMYKGNDSFIIARSPFASVDNVAKVEVKKQEGSTGLCLTFDAKGTKDIAEGSGDRLHPKMAVVIANKLLYVVDNSVNITTGVMCVLLDGYSQQEIETMQEAIKKRM
jgi:hypothetical protein